MRKIFNFTVKRFKKAGQKVTVILKDITIRTLQKYLKMDKDLVYRHIPKRIKLTKIQEQKIGPKKKYFLKRMYLYSMFFIRWTGKFKNSRASFIKNLFKNRVFFRKIFFTGESHFSLH